MLRNSGIRLQGLAGSGLAGSGEHSKVDLRPTAKVVCARGKFSPQADARATVIP